MSQPTIPDLAASPASGPVADAAAWPATASGQACANCGASLSGPYCAQCGQKAAHRIVSLRRILEDALEDQLSLNAALPRTLGMLVRHPGRLTREYISGRVVSYIPPMRLYLIASVLFFLALAVAPGAGRDVVLGNTTLSGQAPAVGGVRGKTTAFNVHIGPAGFFVDTVGLSGWARPVVLRLVERQQRLNAMGPGQAQRQMMGNLANDMPKVVFVLLPLFAALLKLLYVGRRRLYVEHFVFALHVHALAFLVFTILLFTRNAYIVNAVYLVIAIYILVAMRAVYGQGWLRTTAKFAVLAIVYGALVSAGILVAAVAAVAAS